jgi:AcrR family transcriptional regulator
LDDSRSRMVHAAVELIGRVGRQAATVRKVAEAAGVSAPLVMHHFGSKAGLVRACDEHVRSRLEAAMAMVGGSGHDAGLRDLLGVDGIETAIVYVGRSMQDGGEVGREWFDHMFQMSVAQYEGSLAAGTARPSQDPTMLALLLMAMDLGMVVLRPLVEQKLGSNLTDPAVVQRWMRTEFDLLTHGLIVDKEKT